MRAVFASAACAAAIGASGACAQDHSPAQMAQMAGAPVAADGWQAPRSSWGEPDLTGIWPLDVVGRTSTERAPEFGNRAYYTDEEYPAQWVADTVDR